MLYPVFKVNSLVKLYRGSEAHQETLQMLILCVCVSLELISYKLFSDFCH